MRWMFTFSLDTLSSELTVTFSFWCLAFLRGILDEDSLKLYTLIWCRTVACQMEPATIEQVRIYSTEVLLFQLMGTSFLYCYCILVNKRKSVQAAILYFSHWKLLFSYEKCTKLFTLALTKFVEYYINVYIYIFFLLWYTESYPILQNISQLNSLQKFNVSMMHLNCQLSAYLQSI